MISCPQCGTEVQAHWDWCHACGWDPEGLRPAGWASPAPAVTGAAAPRPSPPPQPARSRTGTPTVALVLIGVVGGFVGLAVILVLAVTFLGTPEEPASTFAAVDGAIESADGPAAPVAPAPSGGAPAEAGWRRYTAADGSFGIDFPGEPEVLSTPARAGSRYTTAEQASLQVGSVRYTALFQEYSPGFDTSDPITLLHEAIDPKLEYQGITGITKTPTTFAGAPALRFSGSSADGAVVADGVAFIAENRLFVLVVDADVLAGSEAQRFLDSFALG